MPAIPKTREQQRFRRHLRVRKKVTGTAERPRLVIFRSLKHISAQLVDDVARRTICTVTSTDLLSGKVSMIFDQIASSVSNINAGKLKALGVKNVWFHEALEGGHAGASDNRQAARMHAMSHEFVWKALTGKL